MPSKAYEAPVSGEQIVATAGSEAKAIIGRYNVSRLLARGNAAQLSAVLEELAGCPETMAQALADAVCLS
jgi:hypothetical protein